MSTELICASIRHWIERECKWTGKKSEKVSQNEEKKFQLIERRMNVTWDTYGNILWFFFILFPSSFSFHYSLSSAWICVLDNCEAASAKCILYLIYLWKEGEKFYYKSLFILCICTKQNLSKILVVHNSLTMNHCICVFSLIWWHCQTI